MPDKLKVLVIDDNVNFLQLAELALAGEYDVSTAADGQEGMEKAGRNRPDVILLDVMMPRVSGLEMLRMLLSDETTRDIPVLVLTASHFDPSTEQVFMQERNVKGFLQKPCPVDVLKGAINSAITKKE
ncbi:MAG TPA: response regulator [Elusimicrobiales bacterium]|nr:response regulator [Elusimicrobiales bacterium]